MRHQRHYTPAEANAALEWLRDELPRLRSARDKLGDAEARAALTEAAATNGGGMPGRVVGEGFVALQRGLSRLAELEIVLRDLDRGLVDFPAVREGREVYLCWEEGEDEVSFWHDPEAGHAGRQPL